MINNYHDHSFLIAEPGIPAGLVVKVKSCHELKVIWALPDHHAGNLPITGYKIKYSTANKQNVHGTSSTGEEFLKQLNPGTTYSVRVKAVNAIGGGDFTEDVEAMTQPRGLSLLVQHIINLPLHNTLLYCRMCPSLLLSWLPV